MNERVPPSRVREAKRCTGLRAVLLKTTDVTRYVCSGGQLASPAAAKPGVIRRPGVDSWVMDTGSGHHLKAKNRWTPAEQKATKQSICNLKLQTANCHLEADRVTETTVRELGQQIEVRVLPDTPNVISIGRLVEEDGAIFHWDLATGATLLHKGVTH